MYKGRIKKSNGINGRIFSILCSKISIRNKYHEKQYEELYIILTKVTYI